MFKSGRATRSFTDARKTQDCGKTKMGRCTVDPRDETWPARDRSLGRFGVEVDADEMLYSKGANKTEKLAKK